MCFVSIEIVNQHLINQITEYYSLFAREREIVFEINLHKESREILPFPRTSEMRASVLSGSVAGRLDPSSQVHRRIAKQHPGSSNITVGGGCLSILDGPTKSQRLCSKYLTVK